MSRWRDTNRLDAVAAWIAKNDPKNPIYKLGSNPPLVLAVGRDWARLDVRWNCMRGIHRQHAHNRDCWDGAYVRHYPGGAKPWARDAATAAALGWDPATPTACAALVDAARAAPAVSRSRPPS